MLPARVRVLCLRDDRNKKDDKGGQQRRKIA
jgi:hypothetical protein